ncbi:MAG: N-acetylmuramoyl-L-alanine amidase [Nitrospinota bacterium]|nr:N-acetylmuramoyl-L-alanine amidase [Nitrospinota bacterium]
MWKPLTISLLISATMLYAPNGSAETDRSNETYRKAADYYNNLFLSRKKYPREKWMKSISLFKDVYLKYPKGGKAPEALFMTGKIYQELYFEHKNSPDRENAVTIFRVLATGHSYSHLADDALFRTGEIYAFDDDNETALSYYRSVLRWFPEGDMAIKAMEKIKDTETQSVRKKSLPGDKTKKRLRRFATLDSIRYWNNENYGRVVFDVSKMVNYKISRSTSASSLTIDLIGTRMKKPGELVRKKSGIIKSIITNQPENDITRIEISVTDKHSINSMELVNPSRIVIDIYADNGEQAASAAPSETETISSTDNGVRLKRIPDIEKHSPLRRTGKNVVADTNGIYKKAQNRISKNSGVPDLAPPVGADPALLAAGLVSSGSESTNGNRTSDRRDENKLETASMNFPESYRGKVIVIDPGHGGKDPGAVGKNGLKEKDVALDIGIRLRRILKEQCRCRVLMTRTKDVYMPLEERTAFANTSNANLFVSIHANANPKSNAKGVETYFLSPANSREAMFTAARENMIASGNRNIESNDISFILSDMSNTEKINQSSRMAESVQEALVDTLRENKYRTQDNGVKSAMFYVLHGARMPSILVETAFISNKNEAENLKKATFRERVAKGIAIGVRDFAIESRLALAQ